jgi:hypothetical protein
LINSSMVASIYYNVALLAEHAAREDLERANRFRVQLMLEVSP